MTAIVLAFVLAVPALAQGWREYAYPGFAVQFPAPPTATMGTFKTAGGAEAPAMIYSATVGPAVYSVTVANYAALVSETAPIEHAVRMVAERGKIVVNVRARINGQFGQELNVEGADGSQSTLAIFYIDKKLYQLEAKIAPPNPRAGSGAAIRFQQSLQFRR